MASLVHEYEVIVGNIGTVYSGNSGYQARLKYNTYVGKSKRGFSRASGEPVYLLRNNEILKEHEGTNKGKED